MINKFDFVRFENAYLDVRLLTSNENWCSAQLACVFSIAGNESLLRGR